MTDTLTGEHALVRELSEAFAITDERLLARGYADRLLDRATSTAATSTSGQTPISPRRY